LKSFLAYARDRILEAASSPGTDTESPFEDQVIRSLEELGYELKPQVGVAGYRIDIGVIDKNKPGRYVLGIECDGASYHSARSARDRDRLRQQVLEDLGWIIHRVWSTDWFRDSKAEVKRAVDAIEKARQHWECNDSTCVHSGEKEKHSDTSATIERDDETPQTKTVFTADPYVKAILSGRLLNSDLLEISISVLSSCVEKVVQVESPVHVENVMSRVASAAGSRIGSRIRQVLTAAISHCKRTGKIKVDGDFLWDAYRSHCQIRDRSAEDNDLKRIDRIPLAEITLAMKEVVKRSFTIQRRELISSVFYLLGIRRVTANMEETADPLVDQLIQEGHFVADGESISARTEASD
jgi:very-short-patch-repair endonuclease